MGDRVQVLQEQNAFLKQLNHGLGRQLSELQRKTGLSVKPSAETERVLGLEAVQTLGVRPLVLGYEQQLGEYKSLLSTFRERAEDNEAKCARVVQQNSYLLGQFKEAKLKLADLEKEGGMRASLLRLKLEEEQQKSQLLLNELELMQAAAKTQQAQADRLAESEAALKRQYERLRLGRQKNDSALMEKEAQLQDLGRLAEVQEKKILDYEEKLQLSERREEELGARLSRCENEKELLLTQLDSLRSQSQEAGALGKHELSAAKKELQTLKLRERDLFLRLTQVEKDREGFREEARRLQTVVDNLKVEHGELLKMTENYENRCLASRRREEELQGQVSECKARAAGAERERDQFQFRLQEQGRRLERLARQHKEQIGRLSAIRK